MNSNQNNLIIFKWFYLSLTATIIPGVCEPERNSNKEMTPNFLEHHNHLIQFSFIYMLVGKRVFPHYRRYNQLILSPTNNVFLSYYDTFQTDQFDIDLTLIVITTTCLSGLGSNGDKGLFCIAQSIT